MINKNKTLPYTDLQNKKWDFIYAYNIKTIRDIFCFVSRNEGIELPFLYNKMDNNFIPPPNNKKWENINSKKKDRNKLEYLHATKFLNLILQNELKVFTEEKKFVKEKQNILNENKDRKFEPSLYSKDLNENEKNALSNIVVAYERARKISFGGF